jgi:hypothetical protein
MRRDFKGANSDAYFHKWQISLVHEPEEEEEPLHEFLTGVEVIK